MTTKKKMGRPPAEWVYDLVELKVTGKRAVTLQELAEHTGVPLGSLKAFLRKAQTEREYELDNGRSRAKYRIADVRASAKSYIEPWA